MSITLTLIHFTAGDRCRNFLPLAFNCISTHGVCNLFWHAAARPQPSACFIHRMLQPQQVRNYDKLQQNCSISPQFRSRSPRRATQPLKSMAMGITDMPPKTPPKPHVPTCLDPNQPLESSPLPPPLSPRPKLKYNFARNSDELCVVTRPLLVQGTAR
jgi:hypothetical protein